jgi:hypothetical protein
MMKVSVEWNCVVSNVAGWPKGLQIYSWHHKNFPHDVMISVMGGTTITQAYHLKIVGIKYLFLCADNFFSYKLEYAFKYSCH